MFTVPRENRYFEDYVVGTVHDFGSIAVTEEEMIAFALRYDPQVFHIDPLAAKNTYFGGLIASGWHTSSLMGRLFVENVVSGVASLGSPGGSELRWIKPVRPGDELSIRVTVREAKRSQSKPDRGVVVFYIEMMNQSRETVVTMQFVHMCLCRGMA
jgi:acyl dehydratase